MKSRLILIVGGLMVAAIASAQKTAQSDVTVPQVGPVSSSVPISVQDIYIDGTKVNMIYETGTSVEVPGEITFGGITTSLLATTRPSAPVRWQGEEAAVANALKAAIEALNKDTDKIRHQKVGIDVYNSLVKNQKSAFQASLKYAKYLNAHPDAAKTESLTKTVTQLESVAAYSKSVSQVLTHF